MVQSRDEKLAYNRDYHHKNKERLREYKQEYRRAYYQENKEDVKARNAKYIKYRQTIISRYKGMKGCAHCGNKDYRVLQFDHLDPSTKHKSGAAAVQPGWSKERLKIEIAKCQVLCANCHQIKTHYGDANE